MQMRPYLCTSAAPDMQMRRPPATIFGRMWKLVCQSSALFILSTHEFTNISITFTRIVFYVFVFFFILVSLFDVRFLVSYSHHRMQMPSFVGWRSIGV